jgi:AbrB family looped-hinge helix DNA binding protein
VVLCQSTTKRKLETVKVKSKGQVTIPVKVRRRYEIEEGDLLEIDTADPKKIVIKTKKPPEAGTPVGLEEQKKILRYQEKIRKSWS